MADPSAHDFAMADTGGDRDLTDRPHVVGLRHVSHGLDRMAHRLLATVADASGIVDPSGACRPRMAHAQPGSPSSAITGGSMGA